MKGLNIIQVLARIGQVLSRIVYVCSALGVGGCVVGAVALLIGEIVTGSSGITLSALIKSEAEISAAALWNLIAVGAILCIGELAVAKRVCAYFEGELAEGHPFTVTGAHELLMLGVSAVWMPLAAVLAAEITQHILDGLFDGVRMVSLNGYDSVATGVALIITALVCRAGAELLEAREGADTE